MKDHLLLPNTVAYARVQNDTFAISLLQDQLQQQNNAAGLNPNHLDTCEYNFIQTAIDTGYSEKFVYACINEALKYGLDVNHKEEDGDTIIHTAIRADDYKDNFLHILELLVNNGYDANLKNKDGKTIDDLVFTSSKYTRGAKRQLVIGMDKYLTVTNKRR